MKRAENFLCGGHVTRLLLGEDQLAVGKYVEHSAPTQAKLHLIHSWLLFQFAFQAPGQMANIGSKKTAFDLDLHIHTAFAELDAGCRRRRARLASHTGATSTCTGLVRNAG